MQHAAAICAATEDLRDVVARLKMQQGFDVAGLVIDTLEQACG